MKTLVVDDRGPRLLEGVEAVRALVSQRLRFGRGEYFLDTTAGVPWLTDVLGKREADLALAREVLDHAVRTVEGVERLVESSVVLNKARQMAYTAVVETDTGSSGEVEVTV